jgi:hypothetical protein
MTAPNDTPLLLAVPLAFPAGPQRIQRKRTRGWRMPPNTVSVTRPGKWGNPFTAKAAKEAGYRRGAEMAVYAFREWLSGSGDFLCAEYDRARVLRELPELRGKTLACFCRIGEPCHADVLLELANK